MSSSPDNYLCLHSKVNLLKYICWYQARGSILVASSPEILTRVKKVTLYNKYSNNWLYLLIFFLQTINDMIIINLVRVISSMLLDFSLML